MGGDTKRIEETDDSLQKDSLSDATEQEDLCGVLIEAKVFMDASISTLWLSYI